MSDDTLEENAVEGRSGDQGPDLPAGYRSARPADVTRRLGPWRVDTVERGQSVLFKQRGEETSAPGPSLRYELEGLKTLEHEVIVGLHAFDRAEEPGWIVRAWIEGTPLARYVVRQRLAPEAAAWVGSRIADALAHAHAHGVVHGRLDPSHVLLTKSATPEPRLIGFGIAPPQQGPATDHLIKVDLHPCVAPEQIRRHPWGPASDTFSLGVLLFLMVTGRYPQSAARELGAGTRTPRLGELTEGVPDALEDLVAACLEGAPEDRPAHMASVATQLTLLGKQAPPPLPPPAPRRRLLASRSTTRRPRLLANDSQGITARKPQPLPAPVAPEHTPTHAELEPTPGPRVANLQRELEADSAVAPAPAALHRLMTDEEDLEALFEAQEAGIDHCDPLAGLVDEEELDFASAAAPPRAPQPAPVPIAVTTAPSPSPLEAAPAPMDSPVRGPQPDPVDVEQSVWLELGDALEDGHVMVFDDVGDDDFIEGLTTLYGDEEATDPRDGDAESWDEGLQTLDSGSTVPPLQSGGTPSTPESATRTWSDDWELTNEPQPDHVPCGPTTLPDDALDPAEPVALAWSEQNPDSQGSTPVPRAAAPRPPLALHRGSGMGRSAHAHNSRALRDTPGSNVLVASAEDAPSPRFQRRVHGYTITHPIGDDDEDNTVPTAAPCDEELEEEGPRPPRLRSAQVYVGTPAPQTATNQPREVAPDEASVEEEAQEPQEPEPPQPATAWSPPTLPEPEEVVPFSAPVEDAAAALQTESTSAGPTLLKPVILIGCVLAAFAGLGWLTAPQTAAHQLTPAIAPAPTGSHEPSARQRPPGIILQTAPVEAPPPEAPAVAAPPEPEPFPGLDREALANQLMAPGPASTAFRSGLDAVERGDLDRGMELFLAAWALQPDPATAFDIGLTYEAFGKPDVARSWYRELQASWPELAGPAIDRISRLDAAP